MVKIFVCIYCGTAERKISDIEKDVFGCSENRQVDKGKTVFSYNVGAVYFAAGDVYKRQTRDVREEETTTAEELPQHRSPSKR